MTRDEIMQLDDDALRIAVAKACGYRWYERGNEAWLTTTTRAGLLPKGIVEVESPSADMTFTKSPDYPRDIAAAIALMDSMTYPDGVSVEYNISYQTREHHGRMKNLDKPQYVVMIWGKNPIHSNDFEATADTLPRAACAAWLMWDDAQREAKG